MTKKREPNYVQAFSAIRNLPDLLDIEREGVKENPLTLKDAAPELKEDKELVLKLIKEEPETLRYASQTLKDDPRFIVQAIKENPKALQYIDPMLKTEQFQLMAIEKNPKALQYIDPMLKTEQFQLMAIEKNPKALQYIEPKLKAVPFLLCAIKINAEALQYVDPRLKNQWFLLEAIKVNAKALEYIDQTQKKEWFLLEAIKINAEVLHYVAPELKTDSFLVSAMDINKEAYRYAGEKLKEEDFLLAAITYNSDAFACADKKMKKSLPFVLTAVQLDGSLLEHAHDSFQNNKQVVLAAIKNDPAAFRFSGEKLKFDYHFILEAIEKNEMVFDHLEEIMQRKLLIEGCYPLSEKMKNKIEETCTKVIQKYYRRRIDARNERYLKLYRRITRKEIQAPTLHGLIQDIIAHNNGLIVEALRIKDGKIHVGDLTWKEWMNYTISHGDFMYPITEDLNISAMALLHRVHRQVNVQVQTTKSLCEVATAIDKFYLSYGNVPMNCLRWRPFLYDMNSNILEDYKMGIGLPSEDMPFTGNFAFANQTIRNPDKVVEVIRSKLANPKDKIICQMIELGILYSLLVNSALLHRTAVKREGTPPIQVWRAFTTGKSETPTHFSVTSTTAHKELTEAWKKNPEFPKLKVRQYKIDEDLVDEINPNGHEFLLPIGNDLQWKKIYLCVNQRNGSKGMPYDFVVAKLPVHMQMKHKGLGRVNDELVAILVQAGGLRNYPQSSNPSGRTQNDNHDGTHSMRQMFLFRAIVKYIQKKYPTNVLHEKMKNPEWHVSLELACFLIRAGRINEYNHLSEDNWYERSYELWKCYADQLGISEEIKKAISILMCSSGIPIEVLAKSDNPHDKKLYKKVCEGSKEERVFYGLIHQIWYMVHNLDCKRVYVDKARKELNDGKIKDMKEICAWIFGKEKASLIYEHLDVMAKRFLTITGYGYYENVCETDRIGYNPDRFYLVRQDAKQLYLDLSQEEQQLNVQLDQELCMRL
ncbi:MAG: DUF4116 domain-containing protein [bacterium]